jgi:hypothetical protein
MAGERELLATLLSALRQRSDEEEDKDLKTLFREVRDELRVLNGNTQESRAEREQREFVEAQAKQYPALRSKMAGASRVESPQG